MAKRPLNLPSASFRACSALAIRAKHCWMQRWRFPNDRPFRASLRSVLRLWAPLLEPWVGRLASIRLLHAGPLTTLRLSACAIVNSCWPPLNNHLCGFLHSLQLTSRRLLLHRPAAMQSMQSPAGEVPPQWRSWKHLQLGEAAPVGGLQLRVGQQLLRQRLLPLLPRHAGCRGGTNSQSVVSRGEQGQQAHKPCGSPQKQRWDYADKARGHVMRCAPLLDVHVRVHVSAKRIEPDSAMRLTTA